MTMMHLKYPATPGFYSWDELGCLSRALGFQADMFKWKISEIGVMVDSIAGMGTKELLKFIDSKYFDLIVDKTLNGHSADWNLCVMRKALRLVERHVLTFEDLHQVRAAYQAYEAQDLKGLELDEKTLLRCLKMCGRIIAPLKMQHRIKHMSQTFDEEGRIQLYEFLDLILWCELYASFKLPKAAGYQKKTKLDELYEIPDFQKIVMHNDERLSHYLNDRYLKEEWDFGKETYTKRKLPKEPPVNRDFRLEQIKEDKSRYRQLKAEVTQSQKRVYNAEAGYVRPRPISAPAIEEFDKSDKSSVHTAHSQRPVTVHELIKDFLAPSTVGSLPSKYLGRDNTDSGCSSSVNDVSASHPCVEPAVTRSDLDKTAADIEDLKFQMTTLELKYRQNLLEDMKYFVPGRRLANNVEANAVEPPISTANEDAQQVMQAKSVELATANRLAYAPYRPPPSLAHGTACDARFRGWHSVRTKPGKHYILTTMSYDSSPTGSMLTKLHRKSQTEVQNIKGDYAARFTRRIEAGRPDTLRPATAPLPSTPGSCSSKRSGRSSSTAKRQSTGSLQDPAASDRRASAASGCASRSSAPRSGGSATSGHRAAATEQPAVSHISRLRAGYTKTQPIADLSIPRVGVIVETPCDTSPSAPAKDVAIEEHAAAKRPGHPASGQPSTTVAVTRVSFVDGTDGEGNGAQTLKEKLSDLGEMQHVSSADDDETESHFGWQDFNIYKLEDEEDEQQALQAKQKIGSAGSRSAGVSLRLFRRSQGQRDQRNVASAAGRHRQEHRLFMDSRMVSDSQRKRVQTAPSMKPRLVPAA